MAIINNTSNEIGDKIWVKPTVPLIGIIEITSFTTDTIGETANDYFIKEFRYSKNGATFSEWDSLNLSNLQLIPILDTDVINIEFLYTYFSDGTTFTLPTLTFVDVILNGNSIIIECGDLFKESIFGQWFNCSDSTNWKYNVSNKLFEEGIVPTFIGRGEDIDNEDYNSFWQSISEFFSWFVHFARKIGDFDQDKELYSEFLKQRNLFFCEANIDLTVLKVMGNNYLKEIQKRGTSEIISIENTYGGININGELLRTICWSLEDEFIFNLIPDKYFGWNVGNISPCWKSTYQEYTLNQSYEPNGSFEDISKYPITNTSGSIITQNEGGIKSLLISGVADGDFSGIGTDSLSNPTLPEAYRDKLIPINSKNSYEVSFWAKSSIGSNLTFGIQAFDKNYNLSALKIAGEDNSSLGFFLTEQSLNKSNTWYFIRGIIHSFYVEGDSDPLNIGFGKNLGFSQLDTNYILPVILNDQSSTFQSENSIFIKNLQIKPTIRKYSLGFVQLNTFADIWMKQKNQSILKQLNQSIIFLSLITDESDPDFGSTDTLKLNGASPLNRFLFSRCRAGLLVESNCFEADTYIFRTSQYQDLGKSNDPGGDWLLAPAYKVRFTKPFVNFNGELSQAGGSKTILNEEVEYPQLESIMEKYLLPYNMNFKNNY